MAIVKYRQLLFCDLHLYSSTHRLRSLGDLIERNSCNNAASGYSFSEGLVILPDPLSI